jgi:hypothetical protein
MTKGVGAAILAAVIGLPPLGAWMAGRPLGPLLRFPPTLEIPADYPRFSWAAAGLVAGILAAIALPWLRALKAGTARGRSPKGVGGGAVGGARQAHDAANRTDFGRLGEPSLPWRFPIWGWLACAWTLAWWALAWTRFPWFAAVQRFTFFPLWLGFIVVVNALVWRRSGACFMLRSPRRWLALFAISGGFWWLFEWLDRFAQNWHYLGVEAFGPAAYAAHASVCFSTVLPAVAAVREWLGTHPGWEARCSAGPAWPWLRLGATGWVFAAAGAASLFLTGARPLEAYPALWAAPLLLAIGLELVLRRSGIGHEIAAGDWRRAASWAAAALVCGVFWEMWNSLSLAKWVYTLPFTERWRLFEMPLLGYSGYLPFGLECLVVCESFGVRA